MWDGRTPLATQRSTGRAVVEGIPSFLPPSPNKHGQFISDLIAGPITSDLDNTQFTPAHISTGQYYGLSACVCSKFRCWNFHAQSDGISKWRLWVLCLFTNGISALIKETPVNSGAPFTIWGQGEKSPHGRTAHTWPSWCPDLGLLASRTVRSNCLLFINHHVCGILL